MKRTDDHTNVDPMVDARQASASLRLPYYWFSDPDMRARYGIPHYLLGGLVRYRMSELTEWASRVSRGRQQENGQSDAGGSK